MGRDIKRRVAIDPSGEWVVVQRDETGTVQTSTYDSGSVTLDNTAEEVFAEVKVDDIVCREDVSVSISSADLTATNTPVDISIERDGVEIASVSHSDETADLNLENVANHFDVEQYPRYTFKGSVDGGSADNVNFDVTTDDKVV